MQAAAIRPCHGDCCRRRRSHLVREDPGQLETLAPDIEAEVAETLSTFCKTAVDARDVILEVARAPSPKKSEGQVLLRGADGSLRMFEKESVVFRSIDETLREESLECYAPVTIDDESQRRRLEDEVSDLIVKRVEQWLSPPQPPLSAESEEAGHAH